MKGLADVIEATKEKLNKYVDCDIPTKSIRRFADMLAAEAVNETIFSIETFEAARIVREATV